MVRVLGLAGSPRRGGNTDLLLEQALAGAASSGGVTENIVLCDLDISPCRHCDGCAKTGVCIVDDDMQAIHSKLRATDHLILASPIFFMGLTAQTKAVIDRCQALWVEKYLLKIRRTLTAEGERRKGLFISVGGRRRSDLFQPALATVRAFFATCDVAYQEELTFAGIDEPGEIRRHPTALGDAFAAGARLVREATGEKSAPSATEKTH